MKNNAVPDTTIRLERFERAKSLLHTHLYIGCRDAQEAHIFADHVIGSFLRELGCDKEAELYARIIERERVYTARKRPEDRDFWIFMGMIVLVPMLVWVLYFFSRQ